MISEKVDYFLGENFSVLINTIDGKSFRVLFTISEDDIFYNFSTLQGVVHVDKTKISSFEFIDPDKDDYSY